MQCTARTNFLHKKISYLHALQGNREMGARYLDPKYSRWISVDPALGEYVPGAGKANTKDAGGLPGMGGLFNTVNLNLFHYAGNNPIRFTDPNGESVFVDGDTKDEDFILKTLNKYSYYQYKMNEDGFLEKTKKINKKGSILYSQAIDRLIADENTEVHLWFVRDENEELTPFGLEMPKNIKYGYGGGATMFLADETDPSEMYIYFMKKGKDAKGKYTIPATQVLMHEIVGHADPIAAGGDRDDENAIDNENAVLEQLKLKKQKREADPCHTAR